MSANFANIKIVLINTSHPGNIGATARAMKTMGLQQLVMVAPKIFPNKQADEMASGALDILAKAKVVANLEQAIEDCGLVIGTSARERALPWPLLDPRTLALKVKKASFQNKVAILFGREQSGLTNEELQRCHFHVYIPSNPEYSSLNIASAVQVIAYELRMAMLTSFNPKTQDYTYAKASDMQNFYLHLESVLTKISFLKKEAPRKLMPRLRRLFNRAKLDEMEMNILRGILSTIEKKLF